MGAQHCYLGLHALWGLRAAGLVGGCPRGGRWPAIVVRGVWCQALPLSRLPAYWAGCWGPPPTCGGRGCADVGARHCPPGLFCTEWRLLWRLFSVPLACMPCGGCIPRGCGGAVPGGWWPATVVRGVWGQALSLPQPPVLWGGRPGFRDPCVPGAVSAGVGTQHRPHSVHPCGPAFLAAVVAEGRLRGGAFHRCEGRLRSGAPPPPTAHQLGGLLGSVTHVLWARACGCGGPTLSPGSACPVGAACRGGGGGPSLAGVACYRCEGRLVSGAVPSPAARPLWRAAGVPRPVCPGCGRCGHGDTVVVCFLGTRLHSCASLFLKI